MANKRHTMFYMDKEYPNFGGGAGGKGEKYELYSANSRANVITLSDDFSNYDFILLMARSGIYTASSIYSTSDLAAGTQRICVNDDTDYIWYTITDTDELTYASSHGDYYIEKIYGFDLGGSSGGDSSTYFGTSVPSANLGSDGDHYYRCTSETYEKVLYAESSGGSKEQFFDSGFVMTASSTIKMKCEISSTAYASWQAILGSRNYQPWYTLYSRMNGGNSFGEEINGSTIYGSNGIYDEVIDIEATATYFKFTNGTDTYMNTFSFGGQTAETIKVFSANFSGASSSEAPKMKLYEMSFYEKDVLVKKLIPIIDSNNKCCLLDELSGVKFYANNGVDYTAGTSQGEQSFNFIHGEYVKINGNWTIISESK